MPYAFTNYIEHKQVSDIINQIPPVQNVTLQKFKTQVNYNKYYTITA
jgi:hypothetical protein